MSSTDPTAAPMRVLTADNRDQLRGCADAVGRASAKMQRPAVAFLTASCWQSIRDCARRLAAASLACAALLASDGLAAPGDTAGRTYHVDSVKGDDAADGLAASVTGRSGPWRTLARLARAPLAAGDTVRLACGSTWGETLTLPASGSATAPITVNGPGQDCTTPPAIDGSVPLQGLDPAGPSRQVVRLSTVPLQLHGGGAWQLAHHPNAGHNPAQPGSRFVQMPADGPSVVQEGRRQGLGMIVGDQRLPPGAEITPGTRVHVRTTAWALEERQISAVDGDTLRFARPTVYPALTGWGYFVSGQAWMVDSPGEWHHDAATGLLTLWRPAGATRDAPVRATVLAVGVDLSARAHIVLRHFVVRRVGTGIQTRRSTAVQLQAITVEDTAGIGIAASGSDKLSITDSQLRRTGQDAIQGMAISGLGDATDMRVVDNVVEDSGVLRAGTTNATLPERSYAAIYGGPGAVIERNTLRRIGYIGIRFMAGSRVAHNIVEDSCLVLNDCAGIYTWGKEPNNSTVTRNMVLGAAGNLDGCPPGMVTAAQGIYLDEDATGVSVVDNTVTGADHGIQVHMARDALIQGNRLFGNRASQVWLQATANTLHPEGNVSGIRLRSNLLANTLPGSVALLLQTRWSSTTHFGSFEDNRYLDTANTVLVRERTRQGWRQFDFAQWQQADGVGTVGRRDAQGLGVRQLPFSSHALVGDDLLDDTAMAPVRWQLRGPGAAGSTLGAKRCGPIACLQLTAAGAQVVLSRALPALEAGTWYRMTLDMQAEPADPRLRVQVRQPGPAGRPDTQIADRHFELAVGNGWQRHGLVFQATRATAPQAARLDIEPAAGVALSLGRLAIVRLTPAQLPGDALPLVNLRAQPQAMACPLAGQAPGRCADLRSLATGRPVSWPLTLPGHMSDILFLQDPSLADGDGDGIPDRQDRCPQTPRGQGVDSAGCGMTPG